MMSGSLRLPVWWIKAGRLFLALVLFAAGCAPAPRAGALPPLSTAIRTPQPSATLPAASATPLLPTASATAVPVEVEPAGCLSAQKQAGRTPDEMLAYAESLLQPALALKPRLINIVWNSAAQGTLKPGPLVRVMAVEDIPDGYRLQEILNALHVAGFAAWLRRAPHMPLHILAVSLQDRAVLDSPWKEYVNAYWAGPLTRPAGDEGVLQALKLTPCRWMVSTGMAPRLPAGSLEAAQWRRPDYALAAKDYLAADSQAAYQVSYRIDWLENGNNESPTTMCGPLTWAILHQSGAFPPGYGGWSQSAKSFWLPRPDINGRPWSLFRPDSYILKVFHEPLGKFDFERYPLQPGDVLYTYSGGDGFDHVLVISEVDGQGGRSTVTNIILHYPKEDYSIQRVLAYSSADPAAGIFRNQWANDRRNGRTGDKGFEVFRWAWSQKDLSGKAAQTTVQPGDTLALVAARWKTPPELIAQANQLTLNNSLTLGQVLLIPPNPR